MLDAPSSRGPEITFPVVTSLRRRERGLLLGRESHLITHMSESAVIIKHFFVPSCATLLAPHTLQADGAEDKALLGSNLSADSGAKTRLGPVSN